MHEMEFSGQICLALPEQEPVSTTFRWTNAQQKGIVVFNTPGANANGVKELVLAGMLLASRDIVGGIELGAESERE